MKKLIHRIIHKREIRFLLGLGLVIIFFYSQLYASLPDTDFQKIYDVPQSTRLLDSE